MVNGFLLTPDGEDVFDFYYDIYHSQVDAPETYNEDVLRFNLEFYGSLAMALDQMRTGYREILVESGEPPALNS